MKRLLIATAMVGSVLFVGAPIASADGTDCYTQSTYGGGTRTTCYEGYPSYHRTIIECDGSRCVQRSN